MELYKKEKLEEMTDKEIMDLVVGSYDIEPFLLKKVDVLEKNSAIKYKEKITKEELLEYFDTKQEVREYSFPFLDETTSLYFFGQSVLPAKGFLWRILAEKTTDCFGLVTVDFFIRQSTRNDDTRFTRDVDKFKEQKIYYYDYENHIYEQVNLESEGEKKDEYLARVEARDYVYERLGPFEEAYLRFLTKEVPLLIDKNYKNNDTVTAFELLGSCLLFIKDVRNYIPTKKFFGHVESWEYQGLLDRLDWLELQLTKLQFELEDILSRNGDEQVNFVEFTRENEYTRYFEKFGVLIREKFLLFFFYEKKNGVVASGEGFWKCEDYKLFPTVFEVERRRHFTVEPNRNSQYLKEVEELCRERMKSEK